MDVKDEIGKDNNKNSGVGGILNGLSKGVKTIIILVIVVLLAFIIFYNKDGKIKMDAESFLEKTVDKNDLETVSYTYNAIAKQCKKDVCTDKSTSDDYKYFVSYEGTVTAGIDFKQVKIDVDRSNKKLIITIPEAKITGYNVPISSLNFIFKKEKYNDATETEVAHKLCKKDLETRSNQEPRILDTAKKNAVTVLTEFFRPWIKIYYPKYELEIK